MPTYNSEMIFDLFVIHGENNKIVQRTCRAFNLKYPNTLPMTRDRFARIKKTFLDHGQIVRPIHRTKPITEYEDNQINVLGYFQVYPRASIRTAAEELDISYSSIQRILIKQKMHPYKFIRLQKLHPDDFQRRINFCENLLLKIQEDANFLKKIIWTDEAKFCQKGVYNIRNRHFWAFENPRLKVEIDNQIQFRINVFCLIKDNELRFFMYGENLNGERYVEILENVVENYLDSIPLNQTLTAWYQMDGAPAHSTRNVDAKLTEMFGDRWWGNRGPFRWPPRSPDLTPLDYYLWGRIKDLVYNTPVTSLDDLRGRIVRAFNSIDQAEIRRATQEIHRRILECLNENGGHVEHLH